MKIVKIEALLMDNNELLYMGRTLGIVSEDEERVKNQEGRQILISPRHISEISTI